jgi:ribosomal protein S18 acetylase RimI-like enzyme
MISIRDATIEDCNEIGLITVSASHSAFIGVVPEKLLDFTWAPEASAENWRKSFGENTDRGQRFLVAEQGTELLGFVWSKPWADTSGFDACIQALYVLPTFQKLGVGRRLVNSAVTELIKAGNRKLEIGCVAENPSCGFYRRLGGKEVARRPVRVDRYDTEEIVFGWHDMSSLLEQR